MELIHSPRDHYLATILLTKSQNDPGLEIGPFPGDAKVSPYTKLPINHSEKLIQIFSVVFPYVQPVFVLVNVLNNQIMTF